MVPGQPGPDTGPLAQWQACGTAICGECAAYEAGIGATAHKYALTCSLLGVVSGIKCQEKGSMRPSRGHGVAYPYGCPESGVDAQRRQAFASRRVPDEDCGVITGRR